ncbi:hypothetical protein BJY00DRAFT_303344 [Aspergillus carlsbadensis]|nr:hypothetical protein BJY00DRAFT_303344 [Aspergillus carlsbadensis]
MASVPPPLVTTPNPPSQDTITAPDAASPGALSSQTHVYPVQPSPPPELQPNPQPPNRGLWRFLDIRNLVGFLWLGPALTLLILNFKGHIIGAGLNCSGCRIDPFSTDRVRFIQRLDRTNRNVLGVLQFVAKALEVWFMYVAGSFVYRSVLFLSAKDRRLPISLLLVYAEFMDLLFLKDLALKARELARDRRHAAGPTKPVYPVLFLFILLVAALSVIANLMGVATATLAIPSLQFIDINKNDSLAFRELLAYAPPREGDTFLCEDGELASRRYSCTEQVYSSSMDEMVESAVSTIWQFRGRTLGLILPPVSREDRLSFSLNSTEDDDGDVAWIPNRQLLRAFTVDAAAYDSAAYATDWLDSEYPDSGRFSQALQTQLQRRGPALGMISECQVDREHYIWEISEDRQIHCYPWVPNPDQGRCIRWGAGWEESSSAQTSSVEFTMPNNTDSEYDLTVTVYATPMARWVLYPCWTDGSCPWDQIFQEPAAPNEFNISGPQLTYVYSMPEHTASTVWCYNVAHLGFADYTLDPNPLTNMVSLVQLSILNGHPSADPESNNRAVATVHADWVLAGWSVDPDGEVSPTRGSVARFSAAFLDAIGPEPERFSPIFGFVHTRASAQILSFINYDTATISTAQEHREQAQRVKEDPLLQSFLPSWATVQVWKFGIESRTSILGVVIMTTGAVIVLLTTILWVEPPKSPTGLIVGALVHSPPKGPVTAEHGMPVQAGCRLLL